MQLKMVYHLRRRGYVEWHVFDSEGGRVCFPADDEILEVFIEVFRGKAERQPIIVRHPEYLSLWMPPRLKTEDRQTFLAKVAEKCT